METTLLLVKVLGIYFIVSGIFVIVHKKTLAQVIADLFEHRAITFLIGIMLVISGSFLVLRESSGSDPLSLLVLIVSWAILLKGIAYLFFPKQLAKMATRLPKSTFGAVGMMVTLAGLYLLFLVS